MNVQRLAVSEQEAAKTSIEGSLRNARQLTQVKEFGVDFRNYWLEVERKFNVDGVSSGERRCSEDLLH
jgi:hypothetical protein